MKRNFKNINLLIIIRSNHEIMEPKFSKCETNDDKIDTSRKTVHDKKANIQKRITRNSFTECYLLLKNSHRVACFSMHNIVET